MSQWMERKEGKKIEDVKVQRGMFGIQHNMA